MNLTDFQLFRQNACAALASQKHASGHWEGELSSSALSTATAIVALHCVDSSLHRTLIEHGVKWIITHQNADGGWGDTTRSFSNISTSLLCWSALQLCEAPHSGGFQPPSSEEIAIEKAVNWIRDYVGSLAPDQIAEVVKARYGKDRTFSVPILMLCAICGTLGKRGWKQVLPLPYEMAACPREWFAVLKMPVVSYALPALIAIGRARFEKIPPWPLNPLFWLRKLAWGRVSRLLHEIQPSSGGFLEAAPLTSFVTMSLASIGKKLHPTVVAGVRFLAKNVRSDGSWPIDTNLATWATSLAVKAHPEGCDRKVVLPWLLDQQYKTVHPFTNSAPGGWAWTDLPGGVPDADDTPGAMLAIRALMDPESFEICQSAAEKGAIWLLDLQNRDGGLPTFCKGWGTLPFDRSSPDLTAHALRAWVAWYPEFDPVLQGRIDSGLAAGLRFLKRTQQANGAWNPLWFGNQHLRRDEENPTYGTALVCRALEEIVLNQTMRQSDNETIRQSDSHCLIVSLSDCLIVQGLAWLRDNQNPDGGWGGGAGTPSSIEETGLGVSALAGDPVSGRSRQAVLRGLEWLRAATNNGTKFPSSPIGFYFAKLWYFERLYPYVWTVDALNRACPILKAK